MEQQPEGRTNEKLLEAAVKGRELGIGPYAERRTLLPRHTRERTGRALNPRRPARQKPAEKSRD